MDNYIDYNRQAYSNLANDYYNRSINPSSSETPASALVYPIFYRLRNRLIVNALEVGPGGGLVLEQFEKNNFSSFAVEFSQEIINCAKKRAPKTKYYNENILEYSGEKDFFDIIYLGAIVHLFPLEDARILLGKVFTWLAPGGILFVNTTIHSVSSEGYEPKEDSNQKVPRFRRKWTEEELYAEISKVGFSIIDKTVTFENDRNKRWLGYYCTKSINNNCNTIYYSDELVFQGELSKIFKRMVNGKALGLEKDKVLTFEVTKRPKIVLIIPYVNENTILFLKQYRSSINDYLYELPAGTVEDNELPFDAANRELEEETGCKADKLTFIGELLTAVHFCDEVMSVYLAPTLQDGIQKLGKNEILELIEIGEEEISSMIISGKIVDTKTIASLMLYNHYKLGK